MAPVDVDTVQRLLGAPPHDWLPKGQENWEACVRRKAPAAPGWWQPIDRRYHARALEEALRRGERRSESTAVLVPLWFGNNEDEVPRDDEWKRTLVLFSGDESLLEREAKTEPVMWARLRVELIRGGFVDLSRSHAPDLPGIERFGPYAVTDGVVHVVVKSVLEGGYIETLPSPGTEVPAFSMIARPAAAPGALPPDIAAAVDQLAQRVSWVNDEDT